MKSLVCCRRRRWKMAGKSFSHFQYKTRCRTRTPISWDSKSAWTHHKRSKVKKILLKEKFIVKRKVSNFHFNKFEFLSVLFVRGRQVSINNEKKWTMSYEYSIKSSINSLINNSMACGVHSGNCDWSWEKVWKFLRTLKLFNLNIEGWTLSIRLK